MQSKPEVRARYQAALDALVARLQQDPYILAAIVYGSVARGEAWEKSDIDLDIIQQDGSAGQTRHLYLVEDGINISATLIARSSFKRSVDGALQGSFIHSLRSHAKLLFSKDESITAWYSESNQIGERDQAYQLLAAASGVPALLDKAEKWLYVKDDPEYSFVWILYVVNSLARIEVIWNGEAPGREVIHQAMRYNPAFFKAVYTDLIHGPKDRQTMQQALDRLNAYMDERAQRLFQPVLEYLAEADGMRTLSDLNDYFRQKVRPDEFFWADLFWAYEWLSRKGIITKAAAPLRLTKKSQVAVEQPAYFYAPDEYLWG